MGVPKRRARSSIKQRGWSARSPQELRETATLLKQLGDPNRLHILAILAEGEERVSELRASLRQSQTLVSYHLALLRAGGMITPRRAGQNQYYSLTSAGRRVADSVLRLVKR
jgi:DNA-binding transcriptional ArsR family regulator